MRLGIPEPGSKTFSLVVYPLEWADIRELAEFAKVGIAYDAHAAYVAQIFVYIMLRPHDLLGDSNTQAAFAAISSQPDSRGEVVLQLPKGEMRQLLMMLGMAAESEDLAEIVNDAQPEEFPHKFPDLELPSGYYAKALDHLLNALYEDKALTVNWPLDP